MLLQTPQANEEEKGEIILTPWPPWPPLPPWPPWLHWLPWPRKRRMMTKQRTAIRAQGRVAVEAVLDVAEFFRVVVIRVSGPWAWI